MLSETKSRSAGKKIIISGVIFLIIGLAIGKFFLGGEPRISDNKERKILYYRNPMNPQETSPTPKKASDGMDFVPVYEEEKSGDGKKKIAYYQDPMHPWYTSDKPGTAPDCGMDLVPVYEGEGNVEGIKIDPVTVQNIGVKIETVEKRKLEKTIRTVGKVEYDETKVYSINTKIMGWVEKLHVDYTGKYVQKGQPLLEIYSPELVSTQEEYLQAIKYQKKMLASSSPEAQRGSNDLIESAKRRLEYWDISEKEINELEKRGTPNKTMTIYSPVDGIVTEKMVLQGQNIMAGMELFKIADLSNVWVIADVYQYEVPWIKNGQEIELNLSYLPNKSYKGKITYIYPFLNEESKTVKVRAEVRNTASYDFKPGMFANVNIKSPVSIDAVAVPEQSLIRSGERTVAVISLGGGYFDPREVKTGVNASGYVQILDGIKEGEKIVTSSQFLIDSESNLKAAINLMRGHVGMDMSKPMDEEKMEDGKGKMEDLSGETLVKTDGKKDKEEMNHSKMKHDQMKEDKEMDHEQMKDEDKMDHEKMDMKEEESHSGHDETSPLIRKGVIDLKSIDKNKDGKVFQDVMDWNVISDEPGKCPICGMELKEVSLEEAKKNLIENGFKVK